MAAAAARRRRVDPGGTPRVACKQCGPNACAQYAAAPGELASKMQRARACSQCGCDCEAHETEGEAATRQARQRRAAQRQDRLRQEQEDGAAAREAAPSAPNAASHGDTQRAQRVAAAAVRRAAVEASGDALQESDCDVLTQSKRGPCSACGPACPGFRLLYRAADANDPDVMFFCSLCGCRAEAHAVDGAWRREEAARQAAEAAAARRAAAARQASAAALVAARREEAEAFGELGLPFGADGRAVGRAYRRLALRVHPDKQQGSGGEAEERWLRVAQAYRLLSNAQA
jgi:hypothetical protein